MPRVKSKYPDECRKIGDRFIYVIEERLGWSLTRAAEELGYANPTTLYAIKDGRALPAPEKILLAAEKFKDKRGRKMDLHWLFTGVRLPFIELKSAGEKTPIENDIINLLSTLSVKQKKALFILLGSQ